MKFDKTSTRLLKIKNLEKQTTWKVSEEVQFCVFINCALESRYIEEKSFMARIEGFLAFLLSAVIMQVHVSRFGSV